MLFHYKIIIDNNIKLYIKQFIIIISLLYSYIIEKRILKKTEVLKFENVYFY